MKKLITALLFASALHAKNVVIPFELVNKNIFIQVRAGESAPLWFVLSALPTSGAFICCFVIAGQVFVNRQATHDIRASTQ